jgi:hypothetical protein
MEESDFHVRVDPGTATIRTETEAAIRRPGRSKAARDKAQRCHPIHYSVGAKGVCRLFLPSCRMSSAN